MINQYMDNLYSRLAAHGFDRSFLIEHVFPDWWEDECAFNLTNQSIVEFIIARRLGFDLAELRRKKGSLSGTPVLAIADTIGEFLQRVSGFAQVDAVCKWMKNRTEESE